VLIGCLKPACWRDLMKGMHKISQNLLTNLSVRMGKLTRPTSRSTSSWRSPIAATWPASCAAGRMILIRDTGIFRRSHPAACQAPGQLLPICHLHHTDGCWRTIYQPGARAHPKISQGQRDSGFPDLQRTLLNKIHATEIVKCGLDKIVFSIDGPLKAPMRRSVFMPALAV